MIRQLLPVTIILGSLLTACGISFDLPSTTPGPTVTESFEVPVPENASATIRLDITFGAGELNISPGTEWLVSGTASYNVADLKPEISSSLDSVSITQGSYTLNKWPNFNQMINNWDVKLGPAQMDLEISAGAYTADLEMGDLSLTNLAVKDGASDVHLSFSSPNRVEMNLLRYETGASQVTLTGLANANFSMLEFKGGAGNYSLDFSGELKRNGSVTINTGLGNLTLVIPSTLPVQMTIDGNMTNLSINDNWTRNGNIYTQSGQGPKLTILVEIGAANLTVMEK
jgi:hypothetical protein